MSKSRRNSARAPGSAPAAATRGAATCTRALVHKETVEGERAGLSKAQLYAVCMQELCPRTERACSLAEISGALWRGFVGMFKRTLAKEERRVDDEKKRHRATASQLEAAEADARSWQRAAAELRRDLGAAQRTLEDREAKLAKVTKRHEQQETEARRLRALLEGQTRAERAATGGDGGGGDDDEADDGEALAGRLISGAQTRTRRSEAEELVEASRRHRAQPAADGAHGRPGGARGAADQVIWSLATTTRRPNDGRLAAAARRGALTPFQRVLARGRRGEHAVDAHAKRMLIRVIYQILVAVGAVGDDAQLRVRLLPPDVRDQEPRRAPPRVVHRLDQGDRRRGAALRALRRPDRPLRRPDVRRRGGSRHVAVCGSAEGKLLGGGGGGEGATRRWTRRIWCCVPAALRAVAALFKQVDTVRPESYKRLTSAVAAQQRTDKRGRGRRRWSSGAVAGTWAAERADFREQVSAFAAGDVAATSANFDDHGAGGAGGGLTTRTAPARAHGGASRAQTRRTRRSGSSSGGVIAMLCKTTTRRRSAPRRARQRRRGRAAAAAAAARTGRACGWRRWGSIRASSSRCSRTSDSLASAARGRWRVRAHLAARSASTNASTRSSSSSPAAAGLNGDGGGSPRPDALRRGGAARLSVASPEGRASSRRRKSPAAAEVARRGGARGGQ